MPAAAVGYEPEQLEAEGLTVYDGVHPDDRGVVSDREHDGGPVSDGSRTSPPAAMTAGIGRR